ncbi:hypothetical protein GCM10010145_39010 [Streptomyces ruber]|uniref:Superoxide dismutase n=2 Tax=Streptomyces TaxID=1883 RepID=A0A918BFI7_9ACTN|nr:hypothetical protein [Streptomyces ruber]GGQ65316.1 hypothetical protein GCM10010145_39010 [Streptomyces ruber]
MVAGMAVALTTAVVAGLGGTADSGGEHWAARHAAVFAPPRTPVPVAVTYDEALVPEASAIEVHQHSRPGATTVRLRVTGMRAGHTYGVHVHRRPCGVEPDDSGEHYQHEMAGATAENEVWLDFTADDSGAGEATARHGWGFRPGEASSVVLHDRPGDSGAAVGCFTMPFGRSQAGGPPGSSIGSESQEQAESGPGSAAGTYADGWIGAGGGRYAHGWAGPAAGRPAQQSQPARQPRQPRQPYGWAGPGSGPYPYSSAYSDTYGGWSGQDAAPYGWAGPGDVPPFTWLREGPDGR